MREPRRQRDRGRLGRIFDWCAARLNGDVPAASPFAAVVRSAFLWSHELSLDG